MADQMGHLEVGVLLRVPGLKIHPNSSKTSHMTCIMML